MGTRPDVAARSAIAPLEGTPPSVLPGERVDVSVLVPAKDEEANLPRFMELAAVAFAGTGISFEVIVVDDGSQDATWAVLGELVARYPFLRRVRHRHQQGIADALRSGYLQARGNILVFYPADLQYLPEDIPRLVQPILSGESDMVTGRSKGSTRRPSSRGSTTGSVGRCSTCRCET